MDISMFMIRLVFSLLSLMFSLTCTLTLMDQGFALIPVITGLVIGSLISFTAIGLEYTFKRLHIKSLNILTIGLVFGYFLGYALSTVFHGLIDIAQLNLPVELTTFLNVATYLLGIYLGMVITAKSSEELHVSIPFVKLKPTNLKKKDILLEPSILQDTRIIDLASSGLIDHHLLIPRFILKELYKELEHGEESERAKARRCLDVVKRLESIQTLELRYIETDFPEVKDQIAKLIRLARLLDSNIITSDISRIQQSTIESVEGIRIINLRSLANALKPLTQSGETIQIKIQRYGKESRQGVGYLEDGTMVVVNGGAEFLGEIVKAHVLSVKHTSSGRMIFCNAAEEMEEGGDGYPDHHTNGHDLDEVHETASHHMPTFE